MVINGWIENSGEVALLTEQGKQFFLELGAPITHFESGKRPICKSCLDWSERKSHIAGAIGQWILENIFENGWATRTLDARTITFTESGLKQFRKRYKISTH